MPGDRTEQATPHRREKARKDGYILHSRELTAAAGALAGVLALGVIGNRSFLAWRTTFAAFLDLGQPAHWEAEALASTFSDLRRLSLAVLGPAAPVMATVAAGALLIAVIQTGGVSFHAEAAGFKLDRVNPLTNAKNLFSLRACPSSRFYSSPGVLLFAGRRVSKSIDAALPEIAPADKKKAEQAQGADMAALLKLEDLTLEIGFQLIPLVDEKQAGQLLGRIRTLRRHLAGELGSLIPPVHISDNLRLKPREYVFSLRGLEIGRWQTEGAQLLAVSGEPGRRPLTGKETREPAFGVPAIWIAPQLEEQAIAAGYSVVDAVTVITTHLGELIRQHAWELLGRAEIKRLLDSLNDSHPKLMEELVPKLLTLGEVGRVLEQLLRECVSVRDLGRILEALLETAPRDKSVEGLVEAARQGLGRRLVQPLLDGDGQLPVPLLDAALEDEILSTVSPETTQRLASSSGFPGAPLVRRLADSLKALIGSSAAAASPVLLCPSPARYHVRRWLEPLYPRLAVISAAEIPPEVRLRPVGTLR
jgi:flagellar biosynthesis protein FlhA